MSLTDLFKKIFGFLLNVAAHSDVDDDYDNEVQAIEEAQALDEIYSYNDKGHEIS